MKPFDYLLVGAGIYNSTFARIAAEKGKKILIVEKRNHIGGNCYSQEISNIHVHKYGPHCFFTNADYIWKFVNRFAEFNQYRHKVIVNYNKKLYSFPVNLFTLFQIFNVTNSRDAQKKLNSVKIPCDNPKNAEEWILSQVGQEIYEIFYKGYTLKQWGKHPKKLPASIFKRIPIRLNFNDNYHESKYSGIPVDGYTKMFENMLDHENIKLELNTDYLLNKKILNNSSEKIIYTGKIDELFDYKFGDLEYRSLRFHTSKSFDGDFLGIAQINYTSLKEKATRCVEHKYFNYTGQKNTIITFEYPENYVRGGEAFYPIRDDKNINLYEKYKKEAENNEIIPAGRLSGFVYTDMAPSIAAAMKMAEKLLN